MMRKLFDYRYLFTNNWDVSPNPQDGEWCCFHNSCSFGFKCLWYCWTIRKGNCCPLLSNNKVFFPLSPFLFLFFFSSLSPFFLFSFFYLALALYNNSSSAPLLFDHDHIYPTKVNVSSNVILYADFADPSFPSFHKVLSAAASQGKVHYYYII